MRRRRGAGAPGRTDRELPRVASWVLAIAGLWAWSAPAGADPIRGSGEATGAEWKQAPEASVVRTRALRRARTSAIEAALSQLEGVDNAARKAVLSSHSSWTGAYRIVSETRTGDTVRLEIEVDLDVARLAKRVAAGAAQASTLRPRFSLGSVRGSADGSCGDPKALTQTIAAELVALGAVAPAGDKGTAPIDLLVACDRLGAVRYTHMHAARVEVSAATQTRAVATVTREAFADEAQAAVESGLAAALFDVGARLSEHRRGRVVVRVESSGPGDRVRRLEQAISDKVAGVSAVTVAGLAPGLVLLSLRTELEVELLAKRLSALSLPDFSVTIVATEGPDVVTIALR